MAARRWHRSRQRVPRAALLAALVLCPGLMLCFASEGDRDQAFRWCVSHCSSGGGCVVLPPALERSSVDCLAACPAQYDHPVPRALRLLRWSCRDDCRYRCMQAREEVRAAERGGNSALKSTVKYFGKWPFRRILGMQEIASVLFSLANLAAQAHCLAAFLALLARLPRPGLPPPPQPPDTDRDGVSFGRASSAVMVGARGGSRSSGSRPHPAAGRVAALPAAAAAAGRQPAILPALRQLTAAYPYWPLWLAYFGLSFAAWTASAVFHARDVRITERADYLIADALILHGFLVTAARTLGWRRPEQWGALWLAGALAYVYHAHHMLYVLFDYGLNVGICVALGLMQTAMWAVWAGRRRHPGRRQLYTFLLLLNAASLLEVLDFPPLLGLLDAHSLWHAATAPLAYSFWEFVFIDARWCAERNAAAAAARA